MMMGVYYNAKKEFGGMDDSILREKLKELKLKCWSAIVARKAYEQAIEAKEVFIRENTVFVRCVDEKAHDITFGDVEVMVEGEVIYADLMLEFDPRFRMIEIAEREWKQEEEKHKESLIRIDVADEILCRRFLMKEWKLRDSKK